MDLAHNTEHKLHSIPKTFYMVYQKFLLWVEKIFRRKVLAAKAKISQQKKNSHTERKILTAKEKLSRWKKSLTGKEKFSQKKKNSHAKQKKDSHAGRKILTAK